MPTYMSNPNRERFMVRRCWPALILLILFASAVGAQPPKRLLLLAQGPDGHMPTTHEYVPGLTILKKCLAPVKGLDIQLVRADEPWATGPELIGRADGVVLFLCEGGKWMNAEPKRLGALKALAARGGGIVGLHWGIGAKDVKNVDSCLQLLGGCHGGPDRKYKIVETKFEVAESKHPIVHKIQSFTVKEEFYYQLKLAKNGKLSPLVRAAIDGKDETVAWAWERPDAGRSFGFTGLHFHDNWGHESYRRMVAQGVLWTLKLPIPEGGLPVAVTDEDLRLK
jgi:type 1 glutamine amidotransferase